MSNDYTKIALQQGKYHNVNNLMQYINKESLKEQHKKQEIGKATGIDKITKYEYNENLESNIEKLVSNMKKFAYHPQPARRTYIPKVGSEKLRPLGIPAYEDKLVQGVMSETLNEIYDKRIFLPNSYGFRPEKDCHMAIKDLDNIIMRKKVNYIVDADIKGFFDNVDHEWLIKFLEHDIEDKNFIRYIKRFLKSGIVEQNRFAKTDKGTPQGGLISPILANIYLHYVLDLWFKLDIKVRYKGEVYLVRYADDFVCCFEYEEEAKKFYEELKERLAKFNLELAEDKSKIIKFGKNSNGAKESFDFLGFTHKDSIGRTGYYKVLHITSDKKLKSKKQIAKKWIKDNISLEVGKIIKKLNIKLLGHYRYYGISDNIKRMNNFKNYCIWQLYKRLKRRSQRDKTTLEKFLKILEYNPIVIPKIYFKLW